MHEVAIPVRVDIVGWAPVLDLGRCALVGQPGLSRCFAYTMWAARLRTSQKWQCIVPCSAFATLSQASSMQARGATCSGRAALGGSAPRVSVTPARNVACDAKKKGVRVIITVECTEARKLGLTPSRYTTQKNKKNTPGRLEIRKYNKFLKRYTLHKEIK